MLNVNCANPTNIVFGKGQLPRLDKLVPEGEKVMITYGGGSVIKNGMTELSGHGDATPEVSREVLRQAIQM